MTGATGVRLRLLSTALELAALAGHLAASDTAPPVRVGEILGRAEGLLEAARLAMHLRPAHAAAHLQAAHWTLGVAFWLAFGEGVDVVGGVEAGPELGGWTW